jgi:serine/threonine-protein kinase
MGIVWEASHLATEKTVAIKILKGRDASDAARFLREAKVAAGLSHPSIVQVFDFWETEGGGPVFMVMEHLVGETLATRLERVTRLSPSDVRATLAPVASALRAAHARGIVHRDLKPENIFLARVSEADPPEVKVLDFGIARQVTAEGTSTAITKTGTLIGTPYYMAPEQLFGEKRIDTAADVWALGVVLYECLTGERPYGGENLGQIIRRVSDGSFRPLRELVPEVAPGVEELVRRMLSPDRESRPTVAEVTAGLALLDPESGPQPSVGAPLLANAPQPTSIAPLAREETPDGHRTVTPAEAPGRRGGAGRAVGVGIALVALAMAFFVIPRGAARLEPRPSTAVRSLSSPSPPLPSPESPAIAPEAPTLSSATVPVQAPGVATSAAPAQSSKRPRPMGSDRPVSRPAASTHDPLGAGRF